MELLLSGDGWAVADIRERRIRSSTGKGVYSILLGWCLGDEDHILSIFLNTDILGESSRAKVGKRSWSSRGGADFHVPEGFVEARISCRFKRGVLKTGSYRF